MSKLSKYKYELIGVALGLIALLSIKPLFIFALIIFG